MMKFATTTFLCLLLTASFATALRGKDQNSELSNTKSRRHLLDEGTECVTYLRITDFADGPDEEAWTCEFSIKDAQRFGGVRMAEISGLTMEELNEKNATSGGTVLRVGSSSYVETQIPLQNEDNVFLRGFLSRAATSDSNLGVAGPPILHIAPDDENVIEEMDEATDPRHYKHRRKMIEQRRRLAKTTGNLETLVIRVVDKDGLGPSTTKQLDDDIFTDNVSLKTQFTKCSHNNINIERADKQGFSTTYDGKDYKGIIDVAISTRAIETHSYNMFNAAINAAETNLLNDEEELEDFFDLVMICQPRGTYRFNGDQQSRSWLAYAFVDHWISVYNDDWCNSVSAQMHEVGHNLGLLHSGIRREREYSDTTGMMGFSYNYDDIPSMCFNSAKNYQLGWYPEQMLEIDPLALPGGSQQLTLSGVVDYGDSDGYVTVRLNYNGQSKNGVDYYLGYNREAGFNYQTQTGKNQVQIVEKVNKRATNDRNGPGQSWLMKSLDEGGSFSWKIGGTTVTLKVDSISGKNADVTLIGREAPGTRTPTSSPTSAPTVLQGPPQTGAPTTAPLTPAQQCLKKESATKKFTLKLNGKVMTCTDLANRPVRARRRLCRRHITEKYRRGIHHKTVDRKCPATCGNVGVGQCRFLAANRK